MKGAELQAIPMATMAIVATLFSRLEKKLLKRRDVIANQHGLRGQPCATQLTCYYRFVQLTKESFDGAQALLNPVVLAVAVDRRRGRERLGNLYGRCWSQRERLPCFKADRRMHYSPGHGNTQGVAHRLLCSTATFWQAPRRTKPHEHRRVARRHGFHSLSVTSRPCERVRRANRKALLLDAATTGLAVATASLILQERRRHFETIRRKRLPHRDTS